jgi:2-polyprenyl-3-methyl-5-hydroxy-6-metoxy-1,4-benzoquinol methylase
MTTARLFKSAGKDAFRRLIPIGFRKRIATWIHAQSWISADRRAWWSMELVRDLAQNNPNAYHKFLWAHHLGYAAPYEVGDRFGAENMRLSRLIFFQELTKCMAASGISGQRIGSVLEVGCSLGYQLRYLETDLFREARLLEGIDIDDYAVRTGRDYLASVGSRLSLVCGDIQDLDRLVGQRAYDLILCTGVLMYLKQHDAAELVRNMLSRSRVMLAMAGLAHPREDNSLLARSDVRERDHTLIHNFDEMVRGAGGSVLARRWEGSRLVDGQSVYFVFAKPGKG